MLTTRTPPQTCPACGTRLSATTHMRDNIIPKAGDLTVCIECVSVLTFEPGLLMRVFTREEMAKLPTSTLDELSKTQAAIHCMHFENRRRKARNN